MTDNKIDAIDVTRIASGTGVDSLRAHLRDHSEGFSPAQVAFLEQQATLEAIAAEGLPSKSASNETRPNNVAGIESDSQGIEGAHECRAVLDSAFNLTLEQARESYSADDPLYEAEGGKTPGAVGYESMGYKRPSG